jgi:hypothetical protein
VLLYESPVTPVRLKVVAFGYQSTAHRDKDMAKRVSKEKRARLQYLRDKYQDESVAQKILAKMVWIGQTAEQLTDTLGHPAATDHNQLKTKTRDIWKYRYQGTNRGELRIIVENGEVTGWDSKSS